jgi:hypothetical protein
MQTFIDGIRAELASIGDNALYYIALFASVLILCKAATAVMKLLIKKLEEIAGMRL